MRFRFQDTFLTWFSLLLIPFPPNSDVKNPSYFRFEYYQQTYLLCFRNQFAAASEGVDVFIPVDTTVNIPEIIEPLVKTPEIPEPSESSPGDLVEQPEAEEQASDLDVSSDVSSVTSSDASNNSSSDASSDASIANVSSIHTGNDTVATEDEIPSFSEWTQKVLAEEGKSGSNGNSSSATTPQKSNGAPKLRQKNYASPDCGSKILGFNPEAQHASALLDPSRDEYLLSICSTKIWFVIELCEAIRASKVTSRLMNLKRTVAFITCPLTDRWRLPILNCFHLHPRTFEF